jgi:hypothetical protein
MNKPSDADKRIAEDTRQSDSDIVSRDQRVRYTDEQWAAISKELPEKIDLAGVGAADVEDVRAKLERECNAYLTILKIDVKNFIRSENAAWTKLALKARALLESWPSQLTTTANLNNYGKEAPEPLWEDLKILVERLEDQAKSSIPLPKGPRPVERDALVFKLIFNWALLGGNVGTSTSAYTKEAGGPLVRFLIAAANPVLRKNKLSPDGVRALVRKYKQKNKPPYNVRVRM